LRQAGATLEREAIEQAALREKLQQEGQHDFFSAIINVAQPDSVV